MRLRAEAISDGQSFGASLRRLRIAAGLSQQALAECAGLSIEAISALERGTRKAPQRQTLTALVDALRIAGPEREMLERAALREARPRAPVAYGVVAQRRRRHGNVPATLNRFFGREREIKELLQLLESARLLTIWGPGGVGKTRLAIEAADAIGDRFPDGVWFADLAPIHDPSLVLPTVAAIFGLREQPDRDLTQMLIASLREKQALLVVDTCEHVLDAASHLSQQLLGAASRIQMVCTSREVLNVTGERVYELLPLSIPDVDDPRELQDFAAVRLFIDRAKDAAAALQRSPEDMMAIATICRRLDGIPLALELAAACAPTMSTPQIAATLDERFKLLTRGTRTALPRHKTLRGTLDWSYGLLSDRERTTFRRLSIMVGSWTADDAIAIAGEGDGDSWPVAEDLQRLLALSLIAAASATHEPRFRMLDTTRFYGLELLAKSGEVARCERARVVHAVGLAERASSAWTEGRDEGVLRFAPEADNFRAALEWAIVRRGDPNLGAELAEALCGFWDLMGQQMEGIRWLQGTLEALDLETPSRAAVGALLGLAQLERRVDQHRRAYETALRAHDFAARLPEDRQLYARTLMRRGINAAAIGKAEESHAMLADALENFRAVGDEHGVTRCLEAQGIRALESCEFETARKKWQQLIELPHFANSPRHRSHAMLCLAEAEFNLNNCSAAIAQGRKALAVARRLHSPHLTALALVNLAAYLAGNGDLNEASAVAFEALEFAREKSYAVLAYWAMQHLALIGALRGNQQTVACVVGYIDRCIADSGSVRTGTELRNYERLMTILREALSPEQLRIALKTGSNLDENAVMLRLAAAADFNQ